MAEEKKAEVSARKRGIAIALNLMLGWMGGHRFYTGQIGTAIAMMFTLGGFGIWWFYDLVILSLGTYKDNEGKVVSTWF